MEPAGGRTTTPPSVPDQPPNQNAGPVIKAKAAPRSRATTEALSNKMTPTR